MTPAEALRELVALKDLKDEESRLRQRRECSIMRKPNSLSVANAMRDDYNRRKPLAWAAARAVLAETAPAMPGLCRTDGRCQYAIDNGAEGLGHCPKGKCCMPPAGTAQMAPAAGGK